MTTQREVIFRPDLHRWVQGKGQYVDDIKLPGMCYAAFVRSPHSRARITKIVTDQAMLLPGAIAVLTPEDLLPHLTKGGGGFELGPAYSSITNQGGTYDRSHLPDGEVVFTGEPVIAVVAESRYIAEDMVDAIIVEYDPLPPVLDLDKALEPDSHVIHEQLGGNIFFRREFMAGDVDKAFAEADLILEKTFRWPLQSAVAMETRGVVASFERREDRFTIWASSQGPHQMRSSYAGAFGLDESSVRAICPDVGGSFGSKGAGLPEGISLAFLAKQIERPIKWIEDRRENLYACGHSHGQIVRVSAAFKQDGTLLGLRNKSLMDGGAHSTPPAGASTEPSTNPLSMPGPYHLDAYYFDSYAIVTNTAPNTAYRATGRPIGAFVMERLIDMAAQALSLDPIEIRRRNFIQPYEFPYNQVTGWVYDSGDYPGTMDKLVELAGYENLRKEQAEARARGEYVGIGVSAFLESGARGSQDYRDRGVIGRPAFDAATILVDGRGKLTVKMSGKSAGQGHEVTYPKWVAKQLGIPIADARLIQGDSDATPWGVGSGNSRSAVSLGSALFKAVQDLKRKMFDIATHFLHTEDEELDMAEGFIFVKEDPARRVSFREVAGAAYNRSRTVILPQTGIEPGLEFTRSNDPKQTFANGVHIAVVRVDVETGVIKLDKYFMVDDSGVMLDEQTVEGQIIGSTVMGFGHALLEETLYDENGQLLTASLMDYLVPTADGLPEMKYIQTETPSLLSLNGAKASGESGNIGAPVAVANAVADALSPLGVEINSLPLSPGNVLDLIRAARQTEA